MAQYPPKPYTPPTPVAPVAGEIVAVPVKSAWWSKINWTAVAGPLISAALVGLTQLPPGYMIGGVFSVQLAQSALTWIFKTYYTGTVTPSSAAGIPPGGG